LITLRYVGSFKEKETEREEGPGVFVSGIVVPLNENESKYLIELIEEGIKNIGENKIKMIVVDRSFFSGENLWEVKRRFGIDFLIYSKSNMDVTKELKIKMKDYQERKKKGLPLPVDYFYQEDEENTGYGFNNLGWFWTYGDKLHQENSLVSIFT